MTPEEKMGTINKIVEIFKKSKAMDDSFDKLCILTGVVAIIKDEEEPFRVDITWSNGF